MRTAYDYEINPQDYYMSREEEILDGNGDPTGTFQTVWDVEVQVEGPYPAGTEVLTRRARYTTVFGTPELPPDDPGYIKGEYVQGYQQVQASPDTIAVYTAAELHQLQAVYQQWVHGEIWNETHQYWERPQPVSKGAFVIYDPKDPNRVLGVEYTADYGGENYLKTIINYNWFTGNVNKHSYELHWPGAKRRVFTQVQVYDLDRFNMDVSDFDGPHEINGSSTYFDVIYYPDGHEIGDTTYVDPYLGVEEPSGKIVITSDGVFEIAFLAETGSGESNHICEWFDLANDPSKSQNLVGAGIFGYPMLSMGMNINTPSHTGWHLSLHSGNSSSAILKGADATVAHVLVTGYLDKSYNAGLSLFPFEMHYWIHADGKIYFRFQYQNNSGEDGSSGAANNIEISNGILWDSSFYRQIDNRALFWIGDETNYKACSCLLLTDVNRFSNSNPSISQNFRNICQNFTAGPVVNDEIVIWSGMLNIGLDNDILDPDKDGVIAEAEIQKYIDPYNEQVFDNTKDPTVDKGAEVNDMNLPANVESTIRLEDGSYAYELDINNDGQLTFNQNEDLPPIIQIFDPPIQSGDPSSPTDYLLAYYKMIDNAASTTIIDETGNYNGVLLGGNNTNDIASIDRKRGSTSLQTSRAVDYINLSPAAQALTDHNKFTVIVDFKPNFAYNDANPHILFSIGSGSNDRIFLAYSPDGYYYIQNDIADASDVLGQFWLNFNSHPTSFEQWNTFMMSVDLSNDFLSISVNGIVEAVYTITQSWAAAVTGFRLCSAMPTSNSTGGAYYFGAVKLLDDCIVNYGAQFTSNDGIDFSAANAEIAAYLKGDENHNDYLKIPGGTAIQLSIINATKDTDVGGKANSAFRVDASNEEIYFPCTDGNGINRNNGSISFWYKSLGDISFQYLWKQTSGASAFRCHRWTTNFYLGLVINNVTVNPDIGNIWDGNWHYIEFLWEHGTDTYIDTWFRVDGVLVYTKTDWTTSMPALSSGNMGIGCSPGAGQYEGNCLICDFNITLDLNTPGIWTAFGKPLHYPIVNKI